MAHAHNHTRFNKVTIIGVGLIGGSLALNLKEHEMAGRITGVGRGLDNLRAAKRLGVIDDFTQDIEKGVMDADLIVVATPVTKIAETVKAAAPFLKPGCIVTDVGSVKRGVIDAVDAVLPEGVRFVAAHPIAGTEHSGAEAAFVSLFKGRKCVITPTEDTDKAALEIVKEIWRVTGSDVICMDADVHDWILAAISHLPHLIAYTLVNTVAESGEKGTDILTYSAGGFRDFTRIASSSPEMWSDICALNSVYILEMIESFQKRLEDLKKLVANGDLTKIKENFSKAKEIRDSLLRGGAEPPKMKAKLD